MFAYKMVTAKLDPIVKSDLNIRLFRNVENVAELRKQIMTGQWQCCLVNPKFILDPFQLVIAANKALTSESRTTKTIFTEILFNLSISKNITKSLQQFGINDDCKDLLVVTIVEGNGESGGVFSDIIGEEVDLEMLEQISDLTAIKKAYKIGSNEEKSTTLLDSIVSRIATKDFISH
ncbi:unnamed protein product [Tenebrio molitor]|nr:unnamed protein product [Tenebrio molitor]